MEAQTQTAECVQGASVWTQGHVCAVGTKHVKCNGGETTANNADNMRQVGQRQAPPVLHSEGAAVGRTFGMAGQDAVKQRLLPGHLVPPHRHGTVNPRRRHAVGSVDAAATCV